MKWLNRESREKVHQSLIGFGCFGGALIAVCGGVVTYMMAVSGVFLATFTRNPNTGTPGDMGNSVYVGIGLVIVLFGVVIVFLGIGSGLLKVKNRYKGPRRIVENARVLARFASTPDGTLYYDPQDIEFLEKARMYVQLIHPVDGKLEYECSFEVFSLCGEGMFGEAEVQGSWLGGFTPRIGDGHSGVGIFPR